MRGGVEKEEVKWSEINMGGEKNGSEERRYENPFGPWVMVHTKQ